MTDPTPEHTEMARTFWSRHDRRIESVGPGAGSSVLTYGCIRDIAKLIAEAEARGGRKALDRTMAEWPDDLAPTQTGAQPITQQNWILWGSRFAFKHIMRMRKELADD